MKTVTKTGAPAPGAKAFKLAVTPDRNCLNKSILMNGFCTPGKCWHKVGISAAILPWGKLTDLPHIRVDAGHVKMNYEGYRYVADTPHHVKLSLMKFDRKMYDDLYIRSYVLRFRRTTKIKRVTKERQEQINAARRIRIAAGGLEYKRQYSNLRKRVEGFSSVV